MTSSKELSEAQQSYFYVVWPEDKSPGGSGTSATTICSTNTISSSTTSSTSEAMPPFSNESLSLTSSSGQSSNSSVLQQSMKSSAVLGRSMASPSSSKDSRSMASLQSYEDITTLDSNSMPVSNSVRFVQQPATSAAVATSSAVSFVIPPLDTSTITTSTIGKHRTPMTHDFISNRKHKHQGASLNSLGGENNLREIGDNLLFYWMFHCNCTLGALAKQALINIQKIMLVTGSQPGSRAATNSVANLIAINDDVPSAKRMRFWVCFRTYTLSELLFLLTGSNWS